MVRDKMYVYFVSKTSNTVRDKSVVRDKYVTDKDQHNTRFLKVGLHASMRVCVCVCVRACVRA